MYRGNGYFRFAVVRALILRKHRCHFSITVKKERINPYIHYVSLSALILVSFKIAYFKILTAIYVHCVYHSIHVSIFVRYFFFLWCFFSVLIIYYDFYIDGFFPYFSWFGFAIFFTRFSHLYKLLWKKWKKKKTKTMNRKLDQRKRNLEKRIFKSK